MWASLKTSDIYKSWDVEGPIQGLLNEPSFFDDSPFLAWLTEQVAKFPEGYKRDFVIGAVNVETGVFQTFTRENTPIDEMPAASVSSSSIPAVWQPRPFKGDLFMDGGTVYNRSANSTIQLCLKNGYTEEQIVLDVLICGDSTLESEQQDSQNAIENLMRNYMVRK